MSRRWTAKCWLGSKSGYVDIEVNANTISGAKEQLQNVYGAQQITNLHEISSGGSGGGIGFSGTSGGTWLVGLIAAGGLFLYFTPWVLMTVYGAAGTWLSQKLVGLSVEEFSDTEDPSDDEVGRALIVFATAIILGGAGFIHGTAWNKDLNVEYNLDGKQTKVEQVRQK